MPQKSSSSKGATVISQAYTELFTLLSQGTPPSQPNISVKEIIILFIQESYLQRCHFKRLKLPLERKWLLKMAVVFRRRGAFLELFRFNQHLTKTLKFSNHV